MKLTDQFVPGDFNTKANLMIQAFDAATNGIIIIDHQQLNDPIIYFNPAFERLTGYDKTDILGHNCRFLQGDNREQQGRFTLKEALNRGNDCTVELLNYRKDGTPFWNEINIAPVKGEDDKITHFVGILNNVTQRKVKELSLQQEVEQSKRLQQQKDEFISVASHELKTPLTSLRASLQFLDRLMSTEVHSSKLLILLGKANLSLNKLTTLVEDLLNVAKLESGNLLNRYDEFSLNEVIEQITDEYNEKGPFRITLLRSQYAQVRADKVRIEQVVTNLIDNAIKFSPASMNLLITIEEEGTEVKVTVRDFGIGIAPDKAEHIFDRYYRIDNSGPQVAGLGLGLYLCQQIIANHGGRIGVESEPGKGSSFWFILPLTGEEL